MFSLLKKATTVGIAALALSISLGAVLSADSADARPIYMKIEGVDGSATESSKDQEKRAAPVRVSPQKRVSVARFRQIIRTTKPARGAARAALKRNPRPPARPGSLSAGDTGGGGTIKGGITCDALGLCFCSGASHCNAFIAACVEVGGTLSCNEHDGEGRPTGCSCFK